METATAKSPNPNNSKRSPAEYDDGLQESSALVTNRSQKLGRRLDEHWCLNTPRTRIDEAKARITILVLWQMFNLPGKPGKSCRSPFREDKSPSFSVSEDGRSWIDFATGEKGDAIDFLAKAKGIHPAEAFTLFLQMAGEKRAASDQEPKHVTALDLKGLEPCTAEDLDRIASMRSIPVEGLRIAVERRILFSCHNPFQGRCFVVTDDARRNAICRRLDGERFHSRSGDEGPKSRCWKGALANWPIGIAQASGYPSIALCEGTPDLLSAFWLAYAGGVDHLVSPVCMTGASCNIHPDALPIFRGKRVRIFGHADRAGEPAVIRWAQHLRNVQVEVDQFRFAGLVRGDDQPVKDLNDFLLADTVASGCAQEVTTGAFDFAFERGGKK